MFQRAVTTQSQGQGRHMNYSMHLCFAMATLGVPNSSEETVSDAALEDVLEPVMQRLRKLFEDFCRKPINPQAAFDLEQQVKAETRELARVGVEWAYNRAEPSCSDLLPSHVEFEAGPYTRIKRKTPQTVATVFGKIRLWRHGYRPTQKTGDATILFGTPFSTHYCSTIELLLI